MFPNNGYEGENNEEYRFGGIVGSAGGCGYSARHFNACPERPYAGKSGANVDRPKGRWKYHHLQLGARAEHCRVPCFTPDRLACIKKFSTTT